MSDARLRREYDANEGAILGRIKAGDLFAYGYVADQYRAAQEMRKRGLIRQS